MRERLMAKDGSSAAATDAAAGTSDEHWPSHLEKARAAASCKMWVRWDRSSKTGAVGGITQRIALATRSLATQSKDETHSNAFVFAGQPCVV